MPLKGKKVFITGGTGGIGTPLVRLLKDAGAEVEIHSRQKHGDLSGSVDGLCRVLEENPPDILINMAGYNDFDYCENQDIEAMLRVNLAAPIRLVQAVLPGMKARNSGQIVNIGSMTALIPLPHLTGYVAAKAGLKGFTDALRRELAGTGISVTLVTPRAVNTGANKGIKAILNHETGVRHDDPDKVAALIFNAICDKKKDLRIGWPERFFAFMNSVFPALVDQGIIKNRVIGEKILAQYKNKKENKDEKDLSHTHRIAS